MQRKKILLHTNAPWLKTGLAENGRAIANWLARHDKYELVYYCSQASQGDANLSRLPYKAYGSIPNEPNWMSQYNGDWGRVRDVYYGGKFIHDIIKAEKPDIYLAADDAWAIPNHYFSAEWFKRIHSILHITVDSVPVSPLAYEQAAACKHFFTWAKFGATEMKRVQPKVCAHVDYMYGTTDIQKFRPVSRQEQKELRKMAGLDPNDTIFIQLSRNQLRKSFLATLRGFAEFKQLYPHARAKLLLHTDWSQEAAGQGWDLPRRRDYLGLKKDDVLATYYCRNCRRWEVKGYIGEGQDCRHCASKRSQVTINGFHEGVEDSDLYQIYGLADASVSAFTSGGLEWTSINSLLCGIPLACTNYSCGEDFCEQSFVYPLAWHPTDEVQSSFVKAATDVVSIRDFMIKVHETKREERVEWGAKGRNWAEKTFSVDAVGAKWESLFDSLPPKDWSTITLAPPRKNDAAPMPQIASAEAWVTALYRDILLCEPDPDGLKNWLASLQRGMPRDQIYAYFINEARKDNAKNEPPKDMSVLFDDNGRKRVLFVIKESGGDVLICTSDFPGLKSLYPDADLYVATDPKFHEILAGNPHVHKVLPYHPAMEQELLMMRYVDHFYHPGIATQRQLDYLTHERVGLNLDESIGFWGDGPTGGFAHSPDWYAAREKEIAA